VARIASAIFGASVQPEHVIGETLRRATVASDFRDPSIRAALAKRLTDSTSTPSRKYAEYIRDPLSIWIEGTFGIRAEEPTSRLIRSEPRSITGAKGAAEELQDLTGAPLETCADRIEEQLLASYGGERDPDTGFPVFAFRLHQFISRGDTVYASLEAEATRHVTLQGQQFVPGDRDRVLLPLVFCRDCGQEYYCVRMSRDQAEHLKIFVPRELSDRLSDDGAKAGFLYVNANDPWPTEPAAVQDRLPDDWLEDYRGSTRVKSSRRQELPQGIRVGPDGRESEDGLECHYLRAPFRFCLNCGVAYGFRQTSDFAKLSSLGTEGRSTATTVLSLAAVRYLRADESLSERARKLLSFTDNRQDASLQAGHFNDFIEIGLLRSALHRATAAAGNEGLTHELLVEKTFATLDLPIEMYAIDSTVRFQALEDTKKALRSVLGYRMYRDLERGWRITSPNLEQCGLLEIRYQSLEDVCKAEDVWQNTHVALVSATPEIRSHVARVLLDFMRRSLAVKVDYLNTEIQERIRQQSSQRLRSPWSIDESEQLETSHVLYPRAFHPGEDNPGNEFLSPRGGFGQFLRRRGTFPDVTGTLRLDDTEIICRQLLECLRIAGLVEVVAEPRRAADPPGYQIPASAMRWVVSDGTRPFHDPIRIPRVSETGGRTNPFFIEYYGSIAADGKGLEAREHTAQVPYMARLDREERFREGKLPILYCSPTMELGVDIAELNVVNLRNIPPTPANYAQRSGRAGRSGQPALVFSYCSTYSSHDQYFFRRPNRMVNGAVTPPRLDLANEDLIRAHVQGIWLSEAGLSLGASLKDILDLSGEDPSLELLDSVRDTIRSDAPRARALAVARHVLDTIRSELAASDWYSDDWLEGVLQQIPLQFENACDRWRGLYRAAQRQRAIQHRVIADATRSLDDKNRAKRLRAEAEAQIELLSDARAVLEADFYSYRYFASEGFLPGYSFPRLPLSAYIPGQRQRRGSRDEFLSRPRFLAISEFGPRSIVYHEGSRFRINRVILPIEGDRDEVVTSAAKQCGLCGYLHPILEGNGPDLCEHCAMPLDASLRDLFRLQNVSTRRAARINSDEEERLRIGYEIITSFRFSEHGGRRSFRNATVTAPDETRVATLTYGHAATLRRVNLGWARRSNPNQFGFVLDMERGYWAKNDRDPEDDEQDPTSARTRRVVPFVEDRRNCLIFEPAQPLDAAVMASLQAALKNAIQVEYQLEEAELAAEPLPSRDNRRVLLFYESAEGGAGVLRRLIDDPEALGRVTRQALDLCHFDPETGEDRRRAPAAREDCEAACYDCLMSYSNQSDHGSLDRQNIRDLLMQLRAARVIASPAEIPRAEHLAALKRQCGSDLERQWLDFIEERGLRLPSHAQRLVEACRTRPDFLYAESLVAVYVDGPHHRYPERKERDNTQTRRMEDLGYTVVRFTDEAQWDEVFQTHPSVFGRSAR
jgi:very-short-patch-repair endonuclease